MCSSKKLNSVDSGYYQRPFTFLFVYLNSHNISNLQFDFSQKIILKKHGSHVSIEIV